MTGMSGNSQPRAIAQVIPFPQNPSTLSASHRHSGQGSCDKKKLSIHSSAESCVYDQGWMYQEEMGNQG